MAREHGLPTERTIFPWFSLPDDQGRVADVENWRQQRNLVLVFANTVSSELERLLRELAKSAQALATEDAVVLAAIHGNPAGAASLKDRLESPFPLLADEDGTLVKGFCREGSSVYITDRFREIYALRHDEPTFSSDEVLEWLAHINRQCPE